MGRSDDEWVAWTREHRVAYELAPLVEPRGAEKVQSGFTLTFYAGAPMHMPAGDQRQQAGRELLEELRSLAQAAAGTAEPDARVELDPPRSAVLRPENEFKPELTLSWRVVHAGEPRPVSDQDRERLAQFEKRLAALGLKRGHW